MCHWQLVASDFVVVFTVLFIWSKRYWLISRTDLSKYRTIRDIYPHPIHPKAVPFSIPITSASYSWLISPGKLVFIIHILYAIIMR